MLGAKYGGIDLGKLTNWNANTEVANEAGRLYHPIAVTRRFGAYLDVTTGHAGVAMVGLRNWDLAGNTHDDNRVPFAYGWQLGSGPLFGMHSALYGTADEGTGFEFAFMATRTALRYRNYSTGTVAALSWTGTGSPSFSDPTHEWRLSFQLTGTPGYDFTFTLTDLTAAASWTASPTSTAGRLRGDLAVNPVRIMVGAVPFQDAGNDVESPDMAGVVVTGIDWDI